MKEHLKCVVWPRDPLDGPEGKIHRYVIVGMLVTDQPLQNLEGENEVVLDHTFHEMPIGSILALAKTRAPKRRLSSADGVLLSLQDI